MLAFGDVFGPLAIYILNGCVNVFHEEHLANLEMVTFCSEVEATTSYRVLVVEIRPLVPQQEINYPRLPIPTRNFKRHPLLSAENIWINELLENKIIYR